MDVDVSIVIPVFNTEKYLTACISSVLSQTYKRYELVIVNDGSTDNSREIAKGFEEKYPDIIRVFDKENGGLSSARNYALERVRGEYVTFLDSDDYISDDYLETLMKTAQDFDCDVVCSGQYKVDEDGKIIKTIRYQAQKGHCLTRRLNISGKLYRISYINKWRIRFPEGKTYEDNSFNLQAFFLSSRVRFIDKYVGYYQVVHEGSITSKPIRIDKLPLKEWERCIGYVLTNAAPDVDKELFEFTVLSFFTYFLLVRNRKREYLTNGDESSEASQEILKIARCFQEIVNQYFPNAGKNKYSSIVRYQELSILQRLGARVFAKCCRRNRVESLTRFVYTVFR